MLEFLTKTKENKENYWALLIEPEWITSSIWNITNDKVQIVATSPSTRWESDLVEPIDASLSACTQLLPEDFSDPNKTVFGLPSSWLENGNIKSEYLIKLKKICDDLSLVPSGFVVLSEAISHYVKYEEQSPLSGIVIGVSNQNLDVSLFVAGGLVGSTSVMRSVSVEDDVIEGISRVSDNNQSLPSRIIIYNHSEQELDDVRNSLNNTDWTRLNGQTFMHSPKVEILDSSKKILAVALAGGSEIANVSGLNIGSEIAKDDTNETTVPNEEIDNIEEPEGVSAADLGFVVSDSPTEDVVSTNHEDQIETKPLPEQVKKISLPKFKLKLPTVNLHRFSFRENNKFVVMALSLITTIFLSAIFSWWYFPKATVTIYVDSKKIDESLTINLSNDLKGVEMTSELENEKTKSTTGTKTVGEKAKGSVKIQNGTAFPISLATGSILLSSSDLKFVTLKSASVSGALTPTTPGVATIEVEAVSIGQEYNLKKDEIFKVGNYPKSEVDATSTDAFSGGSSRQITSVSEDDRKKIYKDLLNELSESAKQEVNGQITADSIIAESTCKTDVINEDYSNKVGDEATNIKLKLKIKFTCLAISKKDLSDLAKTKLQPLIPSGFVLRDDQLNYTFSKGNDESLDVHVIANLLPSIDPSVITKSISGKYPKIAESYLSNIPGFINAEIRLRPVLKGVLGTLPHLSKNITIEITSGK